MVRVVSGELSSFIAGHVYCTAIEGCQEIGDFGRVAEWTAALERWCDTQPGLLAFTGQCAVHRGQLMRLRGAWDDALREYSLAAERYLELGTPGAIGLTAVETGDVLRLRGDLDGADAAYQRAADLGVDPQPGLALLWLASGRGTAALGAVDRLLAEPGGPVQRCHLLPAAVEVLLAAGEVDRARPLAVELSSLASSIGSLALTAAAATALGAVELDSGDAAGALPYLRRAHQQWTQASSPYDAAVARLLSGRCLLALADDVLGRARADRCPRGLPPTGRRPDGRARLLPPRPRVPARRPHRPRGRGAAARGVGAEQPPDRRRAGAEREDGRAAPVQHLRQARRRIADRGRGVRVRARAGVSRALATGPLRV